MTDERSAIEATVNDYLEGLRESNPDRLAGAFHAEATMTGYFGGQYMIVPKAGTFIADYMRTLPPTSEHSPDFNGRIVQVEQHGTLACASVEENGLEGKDMRTFFILHKIDGRWQIASKGTWSPA